MGCREHGFQQGLINKAVLERCADIVILCQHHTGAGEQKDGQQNQSDFHIHVFNTWID